MKNTEVKATNNCDGCVADSDEDLCIALPSCTALTRDDDQDII